MTDDMGPQDALADEADAPVGDEIDETTDPGDEELHPEVLEELVTYTLDWSVQSLLERIGKTFDINPAFQRRDAWTPEKKSLYLESLMLGLPVPQIVLAEDRNQKGRFIVLDGKQRLLTMMQFANPDNPRSALKLRKLAFLQDVVGGMTFEDMRSSLRGSEYADALLSQPVRTVVVRNWVNPAVLFSIFVRLNQGSVSLSPQELRQALYPNDFTVWVNDRSKDSAAIQDARGLKGEDFRMRDAEMLLRFIAFREGLPQYAGNLRQFLDDACDLKKNAWSVKGRKHFDEEADRCEVAIRRTFEVFGRECAFRRFEDGGYNRRFNIAVFDLMSGIFADEALLDSDISDHGANLKAAYERLCVEDTAFQQSLTVSTKTIPATGGRIIRYGEAVEGVTGRILGVVERARELVRRTQ